MMIDLGTGNNNKINWAMNNKQELIDIIECIYRGARKGICNSNYQAHTTLPDFRSLFVVELPNCGVHIFFSGRGLVISPKDYSTKYRY